MAEEIMTKKGNELVIDVAHELIEEEKHQKKTVYFQAKFVDGLLAETINQLKQQMDALVLIFFDEETGDRESFKGPKKKMESIKATSEIFLGELNILNECLSPYNKASLNHKHKAVREIVKEGFKRLNDNREGLKEAKNINNHYVTQFAKILTLFMTNFHVTLHDKTPRKERSRIVREYCEGG